MLLIADASIGIALAGIMGGRNTEIHDRTRDVLIESAYFKPQNIRRTSKTLSLRSESSYRFERGADIGMCDWASRRAAQLILQTAGGELVSGVVDAYPLPAEALQISLRHPQTSALLGVEISADQQTEFLQRLGLDIITGPGSLPRQVSERRTRRFSDSVIPRGFKREWTSSERWPGSTAWTRFLPLRRGGHGPRMPTTRFMISFRKPGAFLTGLGLFSTRTDADLRHRLEVFPSHAAAPQVLELRIR